MNNTTPQNPLIVGTAGHIDHGKSTLIKALTGTDPDRLSEEKRRGITIELGFARLNLPDGTYLGVVDVPGHERFVRQMIAGATGVDLALLCIAADDGVMPQTREHLAVLELLDVHDCVVALTKCDLVDEEWTELAIEEIRANLNSTAFAEAPIVPVSAHTGLGLDTLKGELARAAHELRASEKQGPARLPIDRVFTIKGAGTVVTGTLWQGELRPGDEVEVLPSHLTARVRNIQVHDRDVEVSHAGNRTALNLVGVKTDEVSPGDFLATPCTLEVSDRFDARFTYLPTITARRPLESGTRVHVAHGTREVTGRVLLMDGIESLNPRDTAFAQLRLDAPLPVSRGDRFILRSYSPTRVIGGGEVLNGHPRRRTTLKYADRALLEALSHGDELNVCLAVIEADDLPVGTGEIAAIANLAPKRVQRLLSDHLDAQKQSTVVELKQTPESYWATRSTVQKHLTTMENLLFSFHAQNPSSTGMTKAELLQRYPRHMSEACFEALFALATSSGRLVFNQGEVSHPKASAGARGLEEQTANALLNALRAHGTTPPPLETVFQEAGINPAQGRKAVLLLERQGRAQRVDKTLCFAAESLDRLRAAVVSHLEAHKTATAAELKDAMGTSRKYAISLLEHFDHTGVTKRQENARTLGPKQTPSTFDGGQQAQR